MWGSGKRSGWTLTTVVLFCLFTAVETVWLHKRHRLWAVHVEAARGVVVGTPHWRVYQSRLLGPMLVQGCAAASGLPFARCYAPVFFLLLLAANLSYFAFFLRVSSNPVHAGLCWLAAVALFLAMQDLMWLYLWDLIELSVMLGLVALIHYRAGMGWHVLLWAVALLNRDSWRYIPTWMLLRTWPLLQQRKWGEAIRWIVMAGVCFVVGQVWVNFITERLFRAESMPNSLAPQRVGDLFFQAPVNLAAFAARRRPYAFVVVGLWLAALVFYARTVLAERFAPLCVFLGLWLVSTFCFAVISETRVFFQYIPLLVWLGYLAIARPGANPPHAKAAI